MVRGGGGGDDDDDDVVNLHINFNIKWLEIQNGGRLSLHGTIMVMYWWLVSLQYEHKCQQVIN
jgi:hypothetical protein